VLPAAVAPSLATLIAGRARALAALLRQR
jgi:hypothetical protein